MNKNSINYLVGKNAKLNKILSPFSQIIVFFLDDLSKTLKIINKKKHSDIEALSFFCRKNNIEKLKNNHFDSKVIRFGLGNLFHITPSNMPTNFAYSLIFGLLGGNSNIIKVPSNDFQEMKIICKSINVVLKKKKFIQLRDMIMIVKYTQNDELTKNFSQICDGRLIWGGDETVKNLKKFSTKVKNIDIPFSDRYSICLINSEKFLKLNKFNSNILISKFYNDTYEADQNACSSPHLILWSGKTILKAKKKFWSLLNNLVVKKYNPPLISSVDNYSKFVEDTLSKKNISSFSKYNKSLYVISLKKINKENFISKTKWGYFYELHTNNLTDLKYITNRSLQTITYFGFSKNFLKSFFSKNNFNGIDRVVPIGQALNINLIWDGYDIIKTLSREIDIR